MYALTSIVLLGFDSFIACLLTGMRTLSWTERTKLATLFGVCDGFATLLGSFLPHRGLESPELLLWALSVFLMCKAALPSRRFLRFLPALLSLDNLLAGTPARMVPAITASSAMMAFCGLLLAAIGRRAYLAATREA